MTNNYYNPFAATPEAYTFDAELVCVHCVLPAMRKRGLPVSRNLETFQVDAAVASVAADIGVDYEDERSYDSGDFPKPVLPFQLDEDDEHCDRCGVEI